MIAPSRKESSSMNWRVTYPCQHVNICLSNYLGSISHLPTICFIKLLANKLFFVYSYNFQGSRLYLIKKIKVYNDKGVYLSFTRIDISKLASALYALIKRMYMPRQDMQDRLVWIMHVNRHLY